MKQNVILALQEATNGLLYVSESVFPFQVVYWKDGPLIFDLRKIMWLSKWGEAGPVQIIGLNDFFEELVKEKSTVGPEEKAAVQKYQELLTTINQHLSDTQVYRIGKGEVDVFIVGKTEKGDWAGFQTKAIETLNH